MDIQDFANLDSGYYKASVRAEGYKSVLIVDEGKYILDGQKLLTSTTKVGYGERKWFICPNCSRNTKRLYLPHGAYSWECRECHNLIYNSSRLSGNEFEYVTMQIRRLQNKLGVTKNNHWPCLGLTDASIEWLPMYKPKGMRWKTFEMEREKLKFLIIKRTKLWMSMCK